MINCLEYALLFWNKEPEYRIHYNSSHCINLPLHHHADGFQLIEEYGFNYFKGWYNEGLISSEAFELLKKYFETQQERSQIWIYCDGACRVHSTKSGKNAFVVINEKDNVVYEQVREKTDTTNGEMELHGLFNALLFANVLVDSDVIIRCDSKYVVDGFNEWSLTWRNNGWKKSNNKPVLYQDIWEQVDKFRSPNIQVEWVKGHADDHWNNYVDNLMK